MIDTYNLDHGLAILKQSILMTWGLKQGQYDRMTRKVDELESELKNILEEDDKTNE